MRTFVAVDLADAEAAATQLIKRLSASGARVRWTATSQIHLTLKFLGDVELIDVPRITSAVRRAVEDLPGFEIELFGAGAFPDAERPRTLWMGVRAGKAELIELQSRIDAELDGEGFAPERRRFNPHLTIGRVRGSELGSLTELLEREAEFQGVRAAVDEVGVYSSELRSEGPDYTVLSRCGVGR